MTAEAGDIPPGIAVIGGGPAGLMAAEVLSAAGRAVTVYDKMPSVGRKLLMAGRGGLNLTHSEDFEPFLARYGAAADRLAPCLRAFPPAALVEWAHGLGQPTFVGSSGRIFPRALKASPLLRAWLARLTGQGVRLATRHDWRGWNAGGDLVFETPTGEVVVAAEATVLALGGASWPRLGSDGAWTAPLGARGVPLIPFRPANCGFVVGWSEIFRGRFAGSPLKNIALTFAGATVRGEAVIAAYGLEGGAVYALSAALRDAIEAQGLARLSVDLRPGSTAAQIAARLQRPAPGQSLANRLRKAAGLNPVEINLLREAHGLALPVDGQTLAALIKAVPLVLTAPQSLARAISSAGGLDLVAVAPDLSLVAAPDVFVAGEMLDWEAPTGGYLLQAALASGVAAARGVLARGT